MGKKPRNQKPRRKQKAKSKQTDKQKQKEETAAQGRQKQTRRTSQPERRRETKESSADTDTQEEEQYANHEPGELERLPEEFTKSNIAAEHDTPERTEEENSRYED